MFGGIRAQMKIIVSLILLIVSVLHLLPVVGVLGSNSLTKLYGVSILDSNNEILLRHRAVLFAIIGLLLLLSVFKSEYQPAAICVGLISVASFLLLALSIEGLNSEINRVVKIDWVALVLLIVAGVINILI
ncbi:MAG: phosphopantetheine adenylyltransferase [Candidatus Nanopelagicus sp.]